MAQALAHSDISTSAALFFRPRLAAANAMRPCNVERELEANQAKPLVLVVEQDPNTRSAIVDLLQLSNISVAAFPSPSQLIKANLPDRPGCLIIAMQLPGQSGLECYEQMNALGMMQPVIFLSGHSDTVLTVRAMKAGAVDFLLKPISDQALLDGVETAIALDSQRREAARRIRIQTECIASLTPREFQVMQGVALGRLNKQIAYDLGISEITVKAHRGSVMRKLRARSICDVVRTWDAFAPQAHSKVSSASRSLTIVQG